MIQSCDEERKEKEKTASRNITTLILDILLCRGDVETERTAESEPISVKQLFRFATTRDMCFITIGTVCALIGGAIQPFVLILGGFITTLYLEPSEKVGNQQFWDDVMVLINWLGIAGVLALITSFVQSFFLHRGSLNVVISLRRQYLSAVLRQDATWFDQNTSGVIISQLNDNIARIQDGMGDKMGLLIRGFSMFSSSIIACGIINWQITVISITMGPIAAMTMAMLGKVNSASLGKAMKLLSDAASIAEESVMNVNSASLGKAMKLLSDAASIAEESVMNVKTVQSCNGQKHMVKKYQSALRRALPYSIRNHFWMGFFEGLSFFQIYVVIGVSLWFGCYGYFHGFVRERGDVLLCVGTISLTAYYLGMLGPHMMALLKARVAAAAIYDIIDRMPPIHRKKGLRKDVVAGHIAFKDVYFSYLTRNQPVLNGFSCEVQSGETIALVGASGSGKSTLVSLLSRLYEVDDGKITIDGVPLCEYDVKALRKRIGIVQQEPYLFNGTVKENISLGREGIDDEKIRQAADVADVTEFVDHLEKFYLFSFFCLGIFQLTKKDPSEHQTQQGFDTYLGPGGATLSGGQKQRIAIARAIRDPSEHQSQQGFDTYLGPGGATLSGGQKQRIAIARAIVTDPRILFLDEATSALDAKCEKVVQVALNEAAKGRTTIVIAHRLSTVRDVKKIYVMEKGKVVETGKRRLYHYSVTNFSFRLI
ncbi:unnamed protein product [Haemonchus placei]|uniref:ABC transporter ATP-binding protein n=1 Tax=Haemonchus placei TaxID=6290 RepID=A0A0N4X3G2_HAEPC|nr:unnamed protein product [Haemonchus placei]